MLLGVPGPREAAPARNNLNRRVGAAGNGVRAAVVRVEAHAGQGVRGVPEGVGVYRCAPSRSARSASARPPRISARRRRRLNKQRETEDAVAEDLNVIAAAKAGARLSVRLDSHQPSPTRCPMRLIGLGFVLALTIVPFVAEAQEDQSVSTVYAGVSDRSTAEPSDVVARWRQRVIDWTTLTP